MGILQRITGFLKYYYTGKTKFDIHSPFVFDFITLVMEDRTNDPLFDQIREMRRSFESNPQQIRRNDAGAGGETTTTIRRIARKHAVRNKYGELLTRMVRYFHPPVIIELGTSLGIGTSYLSAGNNGTTVYSIEACENTWNQAIQNPFLTAHTQLHPVFGDLEEIRPEKIQGEVNQVFLIRGTFEEKLSPLLQRIGVAPLVFIDGDHRRTSTLDNFKRILPFVNNDSILIFDDIHWSKGMQTAWEEIKTHPQVRVTLDLYQFGIVIFKKELSKEHFVLRF